MENKLAALFSNFEDKIKTISNSNDLQTLKSEYLGKKGHISEILKSMKDQTVEVKKKIGPMANEMKSDILNGCDKWLQNFEMKKIEEDLKSEYIDLHLTDKNSYGKQKHGSIHPRNIIQKEIEDVFLSMGFEILDGPHIEDEFHNFEALNIPGDHPARDMQDTFWFHDPNNEDVAADSKKHLLRTHTSTIQIRGMLERKPPFRFIAPGKVFRCERTDASHEMVFHQLEGMMVGKDISVSNLIYFMKTLLKEIFKKEVEVRLRPGFFPFVEPGFELDISCLICNGKGCSVCKQSGWVELLPCGMVHPNVLKHGGIDPNEYNGFAFGLGLDRLVMMRYAIDDIRYLNSGDLRFSEQFSSF